MAEIKINDTVETRQGLHGKVVAIGTELGPDYISVQFSPNGFRQQLHKDSLTVIPDPFTNVDGSTWI